ncbi:MAG: hypothetical protein FWE36_07015 [Erysipelotrichales bacterium]|nr:hypothetical protein [Erysipelotrichales bacterium]
MLYFLNLAEVIFFALSLSGLIFLLICCGKLKINYFLAALPIVTALILSFWLNFEWLILFFIYLMTYLFSIYYAKKKGKLMLCKKES